MPVLFQRDPELEPGSVVLVHGPRGTAYQKFFSDGLWHSVTGKVVTTAELLEMDRVVLVYRGAPEGLR